MLEGDVVGMFLLPASHSHLMSRSGGDGDLPSELLGSGVGWFGWSVLSSGLISQRSGSPSAKMSGVL